MRKDGYTVRKRAKGAGRTRGETKLPPGTDWLIKKPEQEKHEKIQCYDPPDIINVCLNCKLPFCDAPDHTGGKYSLCPLKGRKAGYHRGYCV